METKIFFGLLAIALVFMFARMNDKSLATGINELIKLRARLDFGWRFFLLCTIVYLAYQIFNYLLW